MVTSTVVFAGSRTWGVEMTDELERRWDDAIEAAWVELRQRVADRLAAMGEDETYLLEVPDDEDLLGATPYCQVLAGPGVLRVEAVSNAYLDDSLLLDAEQEARLEGIGFEAPVEPESGNFWVDLDQREADRAAWMMVEALRQVYGVVHPVFLEGDGVSRLAPLAPQPPEREEPATYFPQDADDVRTCISRVVKELLGHDPEWDEDGDLPLVTDRGVLYVTVAEQVPRMLLHATLVVDVVDEQRAVVEANILNRREFGLTFFVSEGRLSVRRELPVSRFVPDEVRPEIQRLCDQLDQWVADLVARVGGRGVLDEEPVSASGATDEAEDDALRRAIRVLRELEGEERGSVDPATMVRIFHGDRDQVMAAIGWARARATRWSERRRKADQEGKATWAKACRAQQRYYLELRGRLRTALRLTVQASPKPAREQQLSLFAEDEASA